MTRELVRQAIDGDREAFSALGILWRITLDRSGPVESWFQDAGMDAFGTVDGDRTSVFMTNCALIPPAPEPNLGPAVLRLDVGVEGLPLP